MTTRQMILGASVLGALIALALALYVEFELAATAADATYRALTSVIFLTWVAKVLFSPIGLVGIYGPTFMEIFVTTLRASASSLKINKGWPKTLKEQLEVGKPPYALLEHSVHYYSFLVSVSVWLYTSLEIAFSKIGYSHYARLWEQSHEVRAHSIVTGVVLGVSLWAIMRGKFCTASTFEKYLGPQRATSKWYTRREFWTNHLSLGRFLLSGAGLYLIYFELHQVPALALARP